MAKLHSITRHGAHVIEISQAFLLSCALLAPHPYCIIRKAWDRGYNAATSSKKLMCTRVQAAAVCGCNYMHIHVHSVQCNVNLASTSTCEGLQLNLRVHASIAVCILNCTLQVSITAFTISMRQNHVRQALLSEVLILQIISLWLDSIITMELEFSLANTNVLATLW